jgi:hypothetical protein
LTSEIVADVFSALITGSVRRYELPGICALTLVLQDALDGGVSTSLRVDGHGTSNRSIIFEARL